MLRRSLLCLLVLVLPSAAQEAAPGLRVAYSVSVDEPESGKIKVSMEISHCPDATVRIAMPAWAPGAYRLVKYSKQVSGLEAYTPDHEKLEVASVDEQTWAVKTALAPRFTLTYTLTCDKNRMDKEHCFVAGPDTYLYLVQHKDAPCSVTFGLPEGWKAGTGLDVKDSVYYARDYDTFIDCPTELGKFELFSFEADQATYELVVHAKGPVDGPKLVEMCRKIVVEQNKILGPPPFKRYVFLYHFKDSIGGRGLEHLNSTDIVMPYNAIRVEPLLSASVTSHEYFHLWNVKRIRPFELGPFDYTGIVRSKALWMCEGVTSYFGDRGLVRSGIWKEQQYLDHLAGEMETLQNNADRRVTPVEKASESVWDRKDWPRVDYYNKGELLGLLIDLKLRRASGGRKTLDDVMRHLYDHYVMGPSKKGKGPIGVGYPEDGIQRALNDVSGEDWAGFLADYVSGVKELPYKDVMEAVGLAPTLAIVVTPDLGFDLRGSVVANVPAESPAEKAGVKQGDRIGAVNDVEVTRANLREVLGKIKPGEEVHLVLLRMDGKIEVTLSVKARQRTVCRLRRAESPTDLQKQLLDAWLGKSREY